MKRLSLAMAIALAACLAAPSVHAIEPIPGSITYGGQPRTKLLKSPIGSRLPHDFVNNFGEKVHEVYIIQSDRSLKLVSRRIEQDSLFGDD